MTPHLTHEQLCDLLVADPTPESQETGRLEMLRNHLHNCERCSAELASLNGSLATFRSTATAWAAQAWTQQQASGTQPLRSTPPAHILPLPALWTAAAAVAIAATISLSVHHEKQAAPKAAPITATTTEPHATPSDEALLEEVDATLSSSIPSPMQPLDDPTAGLQSLNKQRKN